MVADDWSRREIFRASLDVAGSARFEQRAETVRHLQWALAEDGVSADVHAGFGLALVSVWVGLVVWCDGEFY
jgi:hypothetical protein